MERGGAGEGRGEGIGWGGEWLSGEGRGKGDGWRGERDGGGRGEDGGGGVEGGRGGGGGERDGGGGAWAWAAVLRAAVCPALNGGGLSGPVAHGRILSLRWEKDADGVGTQLL